MNATDARAAIASLDAAGACGAPTLRSALEALIKIDAAVRADLAAEHELDERHTERLDVRADGDASWRSNPWVWRIEFKRVEVTRG